MQRRGAIYLEILIPVIYSFPLVKDMVFSDWSLEICSG
jgi:hypothetical protein